MPLFEIADETSLLAFQQLHGGSQVYESEIEKLVWDNFEELTGEPLFPVARQSILEGGGRPDIVALGNDARVVVIEVKRDIDRRQLAQCLEYAGWARTTNLDELARMYHGGPDAFFAAWQEFNDAAAPTPVRRARRLMMGTRVAYRVVSATMGKLTRAEPVAALYEQGRVPTSATTPSSRSSF